MNYILPTCNSIVYTFPFQKGRFGYSEEILNQNKMETQPRKHQILQLYVWAMVSKIQRAQPSIFAACTPPSISLSGKFSSVHAALFSMSHICDMPILGFPLKLLSRLHFYSII